MTRKTSYSLALTSFGVRFCAISLLAWGLLSSSAAWAQAESNPSVNAQLLVAARNTDAEAVKKSLARGAVPNSRNRLGKTSLYISIEKNRIDIAQILIEAGADVNLPSLEKATPLIAASYAGSLPFVDMLLQHGAKHEPTDRYTSPLWSMRRAWATPRWSSVCCKWVHPSIKHRWMRSPP